MNTSKNGHSESPQAKACLAEKVSRTECHGRKKSILELNYLTAFYTKNSHSGINLYFLSRAWSKIKVHL